MNEANRYRNSKLLCKNIGEQVRLVMERKYGTDAGAHDEEMAELMVKILKLLGVEANLVTGYSLQKPDDPKPHTWVETDRLFVDPAADRFLNDTGTSVVIQNERPDCLSLEGLDADKRFEAQAEAERAARAANMPRSMDMEMEMEMAYE